MKDVSALDRTADVVRADRTSSLILPLAIVVAWLALKYFDEPVRAWVTRRLGIKRSTT